mmetsp:Transcript_65789/g.143616  ORF Transcript_65789/g.143616 Transcript_65789/m.143616 type:complete len:93 (-) Transcript_65789:52-330(-)
MRAWRATQPLPSGARGAQATPSMAISSAQPSSVPGNSMHRSNLPHPFRTTAVTELSPSRLLTLNLWSQPVCGPFFTKHMRTRWQAHANTTVN